MRFNHLRALIWAITVGILVGGCATQGSQVAYGYRGGPDFNNTYAGRGMRHMPANPSEMHRTTEVVPFPTAFTTGEIIVSFADRRLYYVEARGRAVSYPIAIPRDQDRWEGATVISDKKVNPSWTPTADMLRENPRLPPFVPGGHPMNPLGVRALYLGTTTYRIHGTDAPWTIGDATSKGCIRMFNEHVLDLFERVAIGTRVTVTWSRYAHAA